MPHNSEPPGSETRPMTEGGPISAQGSKARQGPALHVSTGGGGCRHGSRGLGVSMDAEMKMFRGYGAAAWQQKLMQAGWPELAAECMAHFLVSDDRQARPPNWSNVLMT